MIHPPEGSLPAPGFRELPPPSSLRAMIGPGVILAGLSIGSGEFVLWPRLTATFGFAVFWAAWIGVTIQFFLNMEIERYTLATGESAVTGFQRLSPWFGPLFLLCGSAPWIWPGWATGAGTLLVWEIGGNATVYAVLGLLACGAVLSLGPVVYRTVEVIQFGLVLIVFVLVAVIGMATIRLEAIAALLSGAFRIGHLPEGIDLPLLLGALAFAGAGGSVNLAQSNYIRDKGYGMGHWMGRITSPLTGREEAISIVGVRFEATDENLARWRVWWRRANLEHALSFYLLAVLSLALFCLITFSLLPPGAPVAEGFGFILDQGGVLEQRFGAWARHTFLLTGIAVLISTELALLDAVSRVVTDIAHVMFLRESSRLSLSGLYFTVLWSFIGFGVLVLAVGLDEPLWLLVLSAGLNAGVMFLYSGLLLWLNLRTFSGALRPGTLRVLAMAAAVLFFGYFTVITVAE